MQSHSLKRILTAVAFAATALIGSAAQAQQNGAGSFRPGLPIH